MNKIKALLMLATLICLVGCSKNNNTNIEDKINSVENVEAVLSKDVDIRLNKILTFLISGDYSNYSEYCSDIADDNTDLLDAVTSRINNLGLAGLTDYSISDITIGIETTALADGGYYVELHTNDGNTYSFDLDANLKIDLNQKIGS